MAFREIFNKFLSLTIVFIVAAAINFQIAPIQTTSARTPTAAEKELEKYSLKEINTTPEGQRAWYNYVVEQKGVNTDPNKNFRLRSIMANLTNAVATIDPTVKDLPYVYFVNTSTSLNAFCTFGHVMSVNSGTFDQVKNDDELAAIIGHEMGHGQKDHPYKGYKSAQQKVLWANIIGIAVGGNILTDIASNIILNQSIAHGTKSQEKEADNLAFDYILQTNYNPGACAAIWQRFIDISGTAIQSKAEMFFVPSDHPNNVARRDKYVKKLFEYSGKHATAKDGLILINNKSFIKPAAIDGMSAEERSYFVLGNIVVAYNNGQHKESAYVSNGTVYLGNQEIITPVSGDESAQIIADRLNEIK